MNMGVLGYTARLLLRSPGRSLALVAGLALGVALVVSVLFFVDSSSRQLTQTAIAPVPVDMVGHVTVANVEESAILSSFRSQPGVTSVEPLDAVDFATASKSGAATQKTPPGRIFAIDPSFLNTFDLLGIGSGSLTADGVLVSEATASRLALNAGDTITIEIASLSTPYQVKVTGILDTSRAEPLFLSGDPTKEGEFQVVSDIVVMDRTLFNKDLRGPLLATVAPPPANPASALAKGTVSGAPSIDQQQYIKIDRSKLPANPNDARIQIDGMRRGLERQFTGEVKVISNLGSALSRAKSDVLSAKLLFIFLGLPGVALAIFLARYASELYGEARRREIGLLRARGASTPQVIGIAGISAAILGVAGSVLGIGLGTLVSVLARGGNALADTNTSTFVGIAPWALLAGLVMAIISAFVPAWTALRENVMSERRRIRRTEKPPLWKRMWLDVGMLALAGIVLVVLKSVGGFKPTGTEGQAISLSFYLFLAPLFLWIGLTLFLQRILVRFIPIFAKAAAGRSSGLGQVAARGMGWRANRLSSAITVIALTLSFGVSLALFTSTYAAEKRTDVHYVVGSDVRVTPALGSTQDPAIEQKLHVPGTQGVTGVTRDTKALIGSESQTVYGIEVLSFSATAFLPDSFVKGGDATSMLTTLKDTPNGVIVNLDAATKFNIVVGDPVLARLSTAAGGYADVRLQAVGILKFFPTSSQDSDFIMNRALMAQSRGTTASDFYLIRANGTEAGASTVSAEVRPLFGTTSPARIEDLTTALKVDESSLTSLNLGGLGTIERIFTLVIAFAGFGVFLLAAIAERAKEYSTMRAIGASPGQLRRLLLVEGGSIMLFGVLLSVPAGFLIASVLITLLTSIFLLPVGGLSVSVGSLVLLIGVSAAALTVALGLASLALSRLSLGTALREE
jgi:putative ABC transport system permease protein